jgi:hypothetical protein
VAGTVADKVLHRSHPDISVPPLPPPADSNGQATPSAQEKKEASS